MYASDLAYMIVAPITVMMMLIPFMSHWRALNTATCYMILFTVLNCLYFFVGAVVWHDSLKNYSPVYCDIATKMNIGLSVALPLASLCINRRLANLRKLTVNLHPNARRREAIIDSLICLVPTVIFMAVHYTQQGHRYNILQGFGCMPSTYLTEPGFILVILPPILISLVSCVYAVLAIRFFYYCRRDFDRYLMGSGSNMTKASYTRLMLLSSSELLISVPMQIIIISINVKVGGIAHWISWEDTKWGFSRHDSYSRYMLSQNRLNIINLELGRWFGGPFLCVLFFIFFGFSQDVFRSWYQLTRTVSTKVFRHPMPSWDEYLAQRDARTSSGTSRQASVTLFGRVVSLPWKKSVSTGTTKSVSVVLPSHSSSDRSSSHRKHRDSLGFSLATDADADEALDLEKGHLGSCGSSTKNSPISFNEKDMKNMPELDMAALDAVLPSIAPSAAHSQISIQVDAERAERRD